MPSVKPFGWMITSAPSSSAFFQNGAKAGSDSSVPPTLVRISTPLNLSVLHAALELLGRLVAVLHRHGAGRNEAVGMLGHPFGDAVVDHLRRRHGIVERDGVIALRRRRHDELHVDAHIVHVGEALVVVAGDARADVGFLLGVDRLGLFAGEMRERDGGKIEMRLDEFGRARHRDVGVRVDGHALRPLFAPRPAVLACGGVGVFVPDSSFSVLAFSSQRVIPKRTAKPALDRRRPRPPPFEARFARSSG